MNPNQSTQPLRPSPIEAAGAVLTVDGALEHILVSAGHDYYRKRGDDSPLHGSRELADVRCVEGCGLEGDRYFTGKPGRAGQVTFLEAEVVDLIRDRFRLPHLQPSVFRRNLIVRGLRLREFMNRRFMFQGIVFEGAQECKPCVWMDRAVADGVQAFLREPFRGGLRARVCTSGILRIEKRPEA